MQRLNVATGRPTLLARWMAVSWLATFLALAFATSAGAAIDGQPDNQRGDLGYYYAITGGKFPTGTTPNGDNASGGTMRFLPDDPFWGQPLGIWSKDDWFTETAGLALTLQNNGSTVYDNNGIEDGTHGGFYDATGLASSGDKPGLYRGYSMSNNYDWIYSSYFKIETETEIDTIIGYYDENSGFDSDSPEIQFDMNIWTAYQDNPGGNPDSWLPAVDSFEGDLLAAHSTPGSFSWSYTGVDRIFGDDQANLHDEIWRLVFTLDAPITLQPGVYFFSHDAEIAAVPEPATLFVWSLLGLTVAGACRYRIRRKAA